MDLIRNLPKQQTTFASRVEADEALNKIKAKYIKLNYDKLSMLSENNVNNANSSSLDLHTLFLRI